MRFHTGFYFSLDNDTEIEHKSTETVYYIRADLYSSLWRLTLDLKVQSTCSCCVFCVVIKDFVL